MVQRFIVLVGVVAVAGSGSVAGAGAKPRAVLRVTPAKPTVTSPISVSLTAPKLTQARMYYGADLTIDLSDGSDCRSGLPVVALRATRGGTFMATLKPRLPTLRARRWCNGMARLDVRRYGPGPWHTRVLASRTFRIGTGVPERTPSAENLGVPVKITVLAGSTLTASAEGRPDRSTPLGGVLHGTIPGGARPTTDVPVEQVTGSLTPPAPAVFPPDPLCPDTPPPGTLDTVPASSTLMLLASGVANFSLTLNGAPSQLFGCGPAGALSGITALALSGKVATPGGLALPLPLRGSVGGIALPNGSQGGLAVSLQANVDLSGKG